MDGLAGTHLVQDCPPLASQFRAQQSWVWILSPLLPSSGASEYTVAQSSKPNIHFHKLNDEAIAAH